MNLNLKNSSSRYFIIFLIIWGCLNLLQAWLTPLNNDESYYWMYSKYLSWGYFDHPPMIALMIRTGYFLFRNEMGVRIVVVISMVITLLIVWMLSDSEKRKDPVKVLLIIGIISVLPIFNIYGFIATPDSPLLLFSAVFLIIYRRFSEKEDLKTTFLLGLSMAALMYSKYHGLLLIIFVILSNLRLLKSPRFYFASFLGLILFLPHLYWQYSNGFPSLKYHLAERVSAYNPVNVPEYLMNLLLIHNPFILPVFIWLIFKDKTNDRFEKSLKFIAIGFILFFFIASNRYHIEPQWTALVCIPMIILLFNRLDIESKAGKYLKWVVIFFLPLVLVSRIAFMSDFLPVSYLKNEFHKNRSWAEEIEKIAGERPVIFTNSYQNASEYSFYTGKLAHSLNNLNYRKNQYDIWDFEELVHGAEVLYVPHYLDENIKSQLTGYILPGGDTLFARVFENFQSLQRECVILDRDEYSFSLTDSNRIQLQIINPYPFSINLKHKELPVSFQLAFIKNGYMQIKQDIKLSEEINFLNPGDTIRTSYNFTIEELPAGEYKIAVCSVTGMLYDTYNSKFKDALISGKK